MKHSPHQRLELLTKRLIHLRMETDSVSEKLCSFRTLTIDKVQKLSTPDSFKYVTFTENVVRPSYTGVLSNVDKRIERDKSL
jgi:hypothetical protein